MSLWTHLLRPFRRKAALPSPSDNYWYKNLSRSDITPNNATQATAVFACVRVLAETIGALPLHVMTTQTGRRSKAVDHPLYRLLLTKPNDRHTSIEAREMLQGHLALRGNAYCLPKYDAGIVRALVPLDPDRMQIFWLSQDAPLGRLGYLYSDLADNKYRLTQDEVWHLRGLSMDGMCGLSPITQCAKAVELATQAEEHGIKWWKNAAKPGGVIQMPDGEYLDGEAHERMKASWRKAHTADDLYTVAILEGGASWEQMGVTMADAQFLESRRFQTVEICRMFRVPPHMIASAIEHGHTYANVEQSDLDFAKHTLLPWLVRWEQSIDAQLIDDPRYYAKHSLEGLLRADAKTRAEVYKIFWGIGAYSANDILEMEDRDPVTGGEQRFVPAAMVPLTSVSAGAAGEVLREWIADACDRIVAKELRELLELKTFDQEHVDAFYMEKQLDYVHRTLAPIMAAAKTPIDSHSFARDLCQAARRELLSAGEPISVLQRWRASRGEDLTRQLYGDLSNGKN